jgi:hypothetical protein
VAQERVRRLDRCALIAALWCASAPAFALGKPPPERGVALGLFSSDPQYRYRMLLEEIRDLGATHVTIDWVWWQQDIAATEIRPVPGWSATQEQIVDALQTARELGLVATAFPIVRLIEVKPGDWRGRIEPKDLERWWESYGKFISEAAEIAERTGAKRLSIGSEMLSREHERARWKALIDRVRMQAPDLELMYSANWDHFEPVTFWDLVDVVGLTAYWELTPDLDATEEELVRAWKLITPKVIGFSQRLGRPIVFTEIGYPSLDGGAVWPWNETRKAPVDQEEQRRAYAAVVRAWSDVREVRGIYFWNWFGFGGPDDGDYTPRKKPAAAIVRDWYAPPK